MDRRPRRRASPARPTAASTMPTGAVYTTKPLRRKLELSGPILANLWVRTTASDAVVTVRVKDVGPDGKATELTAGWLAGSFRAVDPGAQPLRRLAPRQGRAAQGPPGAAPALAPVHARLGAPRPAGPAGRAAGRGLREPGRRSSAATGCGSPSPAATSPTRSRRSARPPPRSAARSRCSPSPGHASYVELPAIHRHCGKNAAARCRSRT